MALEALGLMAWGAGHILEDDSQSCSALALVFRTRVSDGPCAWLDALGRLRVCILVDMTLEAS